MYKTAKFTKALIENSVSDDWAEARQEWYFNGLRYTPDKGICICGQKHISRIVIIKNKYNNIVLEIGYNCWLSVMGGEKLDTEFKRLRNQYVLQQLGICLPTLYLAFRNYEKYRINSNELSFLLCEYDHSVDINDKYVIETYKKITKKMEFVPDVVNIVSYDYSTAPYTYAISDKGKRYRIRRPYGD